MRRLEDFLREWNPIGVAGLPDNEYDAYAPRLRRMLVLGCSVDELARALDDIRTRSMCLAPRMDRDLETAGFILSWWAETMAK